MKKKILVLLSMACALSMVACGDETEKINGEEKTTNELATDSISSNVSETEKTEEETTEGESVLDELLKNFTATNAVNTTDVSGYSFENDNIVFNVKFDEIANISSIKTTMFKADYSGKEEVTLTSWAEYKDKFDENEEYKYNLELSFSDGSMVTVGKRKLKCFDDIDKNMVWCADLGSGYCQTYETLLNNGAFCIVKDMYSSGLDITSYVDIGLEKGKEASEQLLKLKELWGEPSIISTTLISARLSWCFGNTSFTVTLLSAADTVYISGIEYSWTTYEQMRDFLEEKEYDRYTEAEPQEVYQANLPEKALMTYGDVTVPLVNNSFSNVFELMNSFNLLKGTSYSTPEYVDIQYWYVPGDSIISSLRIDGCNDGTGNVKELSIRFCEGLNLPELSILGINAGSTLDDIFKIFGTPEEDGYEMLIYNVTIDGVYTHIYIETEPKYGTRVAKSMSVEFFYEP